MSRYCGVTRYITAAAAVQTFFPVDEKGVAHICCEQCNFYRTNNKRCGLNGEICEFPAKYIGSRCPLEFEEEANNV